jgi:hypothetical protein
MYVHVHDSASAFRLSPVEAHQPKQEVCQRKFEQKGGNSTEHFKESGWNRQIFHGQSKMFKAGTLHCFARAATKVSASSGMNYSA